jgi:type VI secretion system secreted protein VgrG
VNPRLLTAVLPPGLPDLDADTFWGREGVSTLPVYHLELRGGARLRPGAIRPLLLDKELSVGLRLADGSYRHFQGVANRVAVAGRRVRVEVVSKLQWALQKGQDSRVFIGLTPLELVQTVLRERGLKGYLKADPSIRPGSPAEHRVTYRESPLALVLRVMEEQGWFFRFADRRGRQRMVVADGKAGYAKLPVCDPVSLVRRPPGEAAGPREVAWLEPWGESRPGGPVVANAFNWAEPRGDHLVTRNGKSDGRPLPGVYEYAAFATPAEGDRLARVRQQAAAAAACGATGGGGVREFSPGTKFRIKGREYLLTEVVHDADAGLDGQGESYRNRFDCLPTRLTFRPDRAVPRPVIPGLLSGVVVGKDGKDTAPAGKDVYADEMCRVKVRLGFDRSWREGKDTSVWVRVGQPWAGGGFGAVFLPPVGTEVKVGFEEGDPDRPVVMAVMYNPAARPPTDTHAAPNRFGLWARPGAGKIVPAGGLVFDDTPDAEAVRLLSRNLLQLLAGGKFELTAAGPAAVRAKSAAVELPDGLTIKAGNCSLTMTTGGLAVTVGGTSFKLTENEIRLLAKMIYLN